MNEISLVERAAKFGDRVAFFGSHGETTYRDLLGMSAALGERLLEGGRELGGAAIGLLVSPGPNYVAGQWGIWRAGGVKVPMCLSATEAEWEYAIRDSGMRALVVDGPMRTRVTDLCLRAGIRVLEIEPSARSNGADLPSVEGGRDAMILYTSGTTSRPKGVVTTHSNIRAQIESLVEAWEWNEADVIPLFLPLHHIHGIINVTGCALWSGARIESFPRFDLGEIFDRVASRAYTLFMAVPTIYVKMIQGMEAMSGDGLRGVREGFAGMRLMVSGSAALPATVHERWFALTGQSLLERYGMTEIGMALSNPLRGERRPGSVGMPLPRVGVRLMGEGGLEVSNVEGVPGEIQVRGPGVFRGYLGREDATRESFDGEWFRTGDMAVLEGGYYRIMGRLSVDIIKSGGYKLSALEIESVLLEHAGIAECAVIGLPDDTWGEAVTAVVVLRGGNSLELGELRTWCKERMSVYKIPQRLRVVDALPRNAMGKVTKPAVRALFD